MWLNGHKLEFKNDQIVFTPREGVNRIAVKSASPLTFLILNDEKEQCVEFLSNN